MIAYLLHKVQQVNLYSKLNKRRRKEIKSEKAISYMIRPETKGSNYEQVEDYFNLLK